MGEMAVVFLTNTQFKCGDPKTYIVHVTKARWEANALSRGLSGTTLERFRGWYTTAPKKHTRFPTNLQAGLTVVYAPPCSGKTHWKKKQQNTFVFDTDELLEGGKGDANKAGRDQHEDRCRKAYKLLTICVSKNETPLQFYDKLAAASLIPTQTADAYREATASLQIADLGYPVNP